MEHQISAPHAGRVTDVAVVPGQQVDGGHRAAGGGRRDRRRLPDPHRQLLGLLRRPPLRRREMVDGGPIDVLTGDWLAELTMLILWKRPAAATRRRLRPDLPHPDGAGARHLPRPAASRSSPTPAASIRRAAPTAVRDAGRPPRPHRHDRPRRGRRPARPPRRAGRRRRSLAHLDTGEPLGDADRVRHRQRLPRRLGHRRGAGRGADIVVTGRVTDAALVVGPAAWHLGWAARRLGRAGRRGRRRPRHRVRHPGHRRQLLLLRRGARPDRPLGFPIAEVADDGCRVITKHPGTGGAVTVGTVTAQLLYEIGGPAYLNPDVVARFDTVRLTSRSHRTGCASAAHAASRRRPTAQGRDEPRSAATATG